MPGEDFARADCKPTAPHREPFRENGTLSFIEGSHGVKRYCLALDLIDDPQLIAEYKRYHEDVWPEVKESIASAGVLSMEIYQTGNRLLMVMETVDSFRFEDKAAADASNEKVQEWERLMWRYQKALPQAENGEKWRSMERIFSLQQKSR